MGKLNKATGPALPKQCYVEDRIWTKNLFYSASVALAIEVILSNYCKGLWAILQDVAHLNTSYEILELFSSHISCFDPVR